MTILHGYRIANGKMQIGTFNKEDFPAGWFDAPDKAERAANPPVNVNNVARQIMAEEVKRPTLKLKRKN